MAESMESDDKLWALYQSAANSAAQSNLDAQAERLYVRAISYAERLGPSDPRLRMTLEGLINLYLHRNDTASPLAQLCWRLLVLQEASLGPDAPEAAAAVEQLARACGARGMPAEAEVLYRRRIAIAERTDGPDSLAVVDGLIDLALHLQGLGREGEEEALWRRAIDIVERAEGPKGPGLLHLLTGLGEVFRSQGRLAEAVGVLERALAMAEQNEGLSSFVTGLVEALAATYEARGDDGKAELLLRRALADLYVPEADGAAVATDEVAGANSRELLSQGLDEHRLDILRALAPVLRRLGRDDEARAMDDRAALLAAKVGARARVLAELHAVARGTLDGQEAAALARPA